MSCGSQRFFECSSPVSRPPPTPALRRHSTNPKPPTPQPTGNKSSDSKMLISSRFDSKDADLIFRSSDGTLFKIHSVNLKCNAGNELHNGDKPRSIIEIKQPTHILELLFQFVYPNPQPDLSELEVPVLLELAHAVSRYKVYSAIPICNMVLGQALPVSALEILSYALEFEYTKLMNSAAPHVTPSVVADFVPKASNVFNRTWLLYWSCRSKAFSTVYTTCPDSCSKLASVRCSSWDSFTSSTFIIVGKLLALESTSLENIASVISIRDPHCCRLAAERWKREVDQTLAACGPFSEFIMPDSDECICM